MKRYAGRRVKPKLSQWCATRYYKMWFSPGIRSQWQREKVPGHAVCAGQRWHDWEHLDCCGTPDEIESWACRCGCHAS